MRITQSAKLIYVGKRYARGVWRGLAVLEDNETAQVGDVLEYPVTDTVTDEVLTGFTVSQLLNTKEFVFEAANVYSAKDYAALMAQAAKDIERRESIAFKARQRGPAVEISPPKVDAIVVALVIAACSLIAGTYLLRQLS